MGRTRLVIVLGAFAALVLVLRRGRARPVAQAPPSASQGPPEDTRESLRRFVEAGERMREGEQASPQP